MGYARVARDSVSDVVIALFESVGVERPAGAVIADALARANARGIHSHGLSRLEIYIKRIASGAVNPDPDVRVLREGPHFALLDGGNGPGIPVAVRAAELAVRKAKEYGIAIVGVRRANHFGFASYYSLLGLEHDVALMVFSNTEAVMAAHGSATALLGTNPLAAGFPSNLPFPFVVDMATSAGAYGKILGAAREGRSIPDGWAVDKRGRPTTDPNEALAGVLLPFGDGLGSAIALLVEVLCGPLVGAALSQEAGGLYSDLTSPQNLGHVFIGISPSLFVDSNEFKRRTTQMAERIRSSSPALGYERVYLPGELEHEAESACNGSIPVDPATLDMIAKLAAEFGVDLPGDLAPI